jgi:hypothetical protein
MGLEEIATDVYSGDIQLRNLLISITSIDIQYLLMHLTEEIVHLYLQQRTSHEGLLRQQ